MDFSFRSSVARSHNWSIFSDLSLGDISILSIIALPLYQDDITNAEHYDFREEVDLTSDVPRSMTDQPLLMECLEIKLKLLTIPEMKGYFDEIPDLPNVCFHLWSVLRQVMPLIILVKALDPNANLSIDASWYRRIPFKKRLILWFAQYCHEKLNIETKDLITPEDLMGDDYYGVLKVKPP